MLLHSLSELLWTIRLWSGGFFSLGFFGSIFVYLVICFFSLKHLNKDRNKVWFQMLAGIAFALCFLPFCIFVLFFFIVLAEGNKNQASRYFKIHAAVVNTCLIDPKKEHCPQKLEDIRVIEEHEFDRVKKCCQMKYEYRAEDNTYQFVVRYSPVKAVIFDPRFQKNGRVEEHNFIETNVGVIGQDKISFYDYGLKKITTITLDEWDYSKNRSE